EDNAEFGLGFRASLDKQREFAAELLQRLSAQVGEPLARRILKNQSRDEADICEQREAVAELKKKLNTIIAQKDSLVSAQFAGESGQPSLASLQTPHPDPLPFSKGERQPHFDSTAGDRKSTRLNSSHEWISYAVFCLKKK